MCAPSMPSPALSEPCRWCGSRVACRCAVDLASAFDWRRDSEYDVAIAPTPESEEEQLADLARRAGLDPSLIARIG